jgi:CHAD domain-containing protein
MPYRLKADESVPDGIRRIAKQEIDSIIDELSRKGEGTRDETIHKARKRIKKIRGLLRLVQPELGDAYSGATGQLREAGGKLSVFRDARAIIDTFDELINTYSGRLGEHTLESVRAGLVRRKEEAEKRENIDKVLDNVASRLCTIRQVIKRWRLERDGFSAIAKGLEDTFRRGRQGLRRVKKHPRPESYHDWRKRVKEHWYHTRLLENLRTEVMQAHENSLKQLESWLGTDHNLVVLSDCIIAEPRFYGEEHQIELVMKLIKTYQKDVRDKSVHLGERIYNERPRQFARRMKSLWQAWQEQRKDVAPAGSPQKKLPESAGQSTGTCSQTAA